jgi:hypothetical protein
VLLTDRRQLGKRLLFGKGKRHPRHGDRTQLLPLPRRRLDKVKEVSVNHQLDPFRAPAQTSDELAEASLKFGIEIIKGASAGMQVADHDSSGHGAS